MKFISIPIFIHSDWISDYIQRDQHYADEQKRLLSIDNYVYAEDLAKMGAFEDNVYYGINPSYICYKCNYLFNIQNIESFMRRELVTRLDFRTAGLLMHAKATPNCEFLRYLEKDKVTSIHGQFR